MPFSPFYFYTRAYLVRDFVKMIEPSLPKEEN